MSDTEDIKNDPEQPAKLKNSKNVTVAFKLNGKNYPLWSRLMKVKIGGRGAYSHIRNEPSEPGSRGYDDWEEDDLVVFSWIVDNIKDEIIADFAHHLTSNALWDSLAVTFENKADKYLIYDLEEKAITIRQGGLDLETYYRRINGLWININRCQKQPVTCCDKGVSQCRTHSNEKRSGLNREYDSIKREILKEDPYPSVESAYGWVRRRWLDVISCHRRRLLPPKPSAVTPEIHHLGELGAGLLPRANAHHHETDRRAPQLSADRGTAKICPNFGAHIVASRNTHMRLASRGWGTRSGGRKGRGRERPNLRRNWPSE